MDLFEAELGTRESKFFGGSKPGFVDYMIWPWIERTDAFPFVLGDSYEEIDKVRYSKFLEWKDLMKQDPAVKVSILSGENHYEFYKSYVSGKPDFDLSFWSKFHCNFAALTL